MHHKPSPAVMALAIVALAVTSLAGVMSAPSRAEAAPTGGPPTDAEELVTNSGTVVAVHFPGIDLHGYSGSAGTADAPAAGDPTDGNPTDAAAGDPTAGASPDRDGDAGQMGTMSVIGADDTVRITDVGAYPARVTGLITDHGFPSCTGSLISPDTVLTAGHCVHDGAGGTWKSGLTFHTRLATPDHRRCMARPDGLIAFRGWIEHGDERHDVGLMRLDCDFGQTDGWLGIAPATRPLTGADVTVQGFPGERLGELWMSAGPVVHDDGHLAFYDNDTLEGMSGAPVQRQMPPRRRSCSGPCVVAVHAYGLHDPGDAAGPHDQHNHGPRLTPGKVAALRSAAWPA